MAGKTMASFRLGETTRFQMEWLEKRLGGISATSVIALAVADLYERKQEELRSQLVKIDGNYLISVGGVPIAGLAEKSFNRLPKATRQQLESGSRHALVQLIFGIQKIKGAGLTLFPQGLQQVYGFEIEKGGPKHDHPPA